MVATTPLRQKGAACCGSVEVLRGCKKAWGEQSRKHGWLMKGPPGPGCGGLGRAAARPCRIGPGGNDLAGHAGASPEGFMSQA